MAAKVRTDRWTRRSRGFGFVKMESDADAAEAIAQLDGANLDDRTLAVPDCQPRRLSPSMVRYHELVDKDVSGELTAGERQEFERLERVLERAEEPVRADIERRDADEQRRHEERMAELCRLNDHLDAILTQLAAATRA